MEDKSSGTIKLKDQYKDNPPLTIGSSYWSSEEYSTNNFAYSRSFGSSFSYWNNSTKNDNGRRALCISN